MYCWELPGSKFEIETVLVTLSQATYFGRQRECRIRPMAFLIVLTTGPTNNAFEKISQEVENFFCVLYSF